MQSSRSLKQNLASSNNINTIQTTSLLFKEKYHQVKIKARIHQFIINLKRNNIYSKPAEYELEKNQYRLIDLKGWKTNPNLQVIILLLDITLTMANFFYASFEAFLPEFQQFKERHPSVFLVNLFAVLIYFISIVLSLCTQQVEKGVHFVYLTDIIKKQLKKGRFYVQLGLMIIMIVNMAISSEQTSEIIGIFFFIFCILKQYYLQQYLFKIEIMFINTPNKDRYWNLLKVAILNVMFAHVFASIFLAMLKMRTERHWFQTKSGISPDTNWFQKYLWSFYWACTTMTTIGYGDFTPAIVQQAVIVSFIQIISAIVIAYNISQIGNIILSIHEGNRSINSKIGLLRRMNSENPVSTELNVEIEEYIVNQKTIEESFQYVKHRQLISNLPYQLQKKYYAESQKNIFRHLTFFMNLSSDTLIKFFLQSTGKVFYPGEFIINKNFDQEIIIALKGELGYCYRKSGSNLNQTIVETVSVDYSKDKPILLAKNVLNRMEGIYYDIKATRYSYTLMISMQTFTEVLSQSQLDYHYFLMFRDMHQGDSSLATTPCQNCMLSNHTRFQCPKLHFMPLKTIVAAKYAADGKEKQKRLDKKILIRKKWYNRHPYLLNKVDRDQQRFSEKKINSELDLGRKISILRSIGTQKQIIQNIQYQQQGIFSHNFDDIDQLADFHHYFVSSNPQKLINIPLLTRSDYL